MDPMLTDEESMILTKAVAEALPPNRKNVGFLIVTFPMDDEPVEPGAQMTCGFSSNAPLPVALKVVAIFGAKAQEMIEGSIAASQARIEQESKDRSNKPGWGQR